MFEKIEKIHYTSLRSTMDFVHTTATTLNPDTLYRVSTDFQTHGRGQYGRPFSAKTGKSLLTSYIFSFEPFKQKPPLFIQIAALQVAELLIHHHLLAHIKWPNDILVHGKKIAGLIAEITDKDGISWCNLGIGLNVNLTEPETSAINDMTTSMLVETGLPHDIQPLQDSLDTLIFETLKSFYTSGFKPFSTGFNRAFLFTGKPATAIYQGKTVKGICQGLDKEGFIMFENEKGETQRFNPVALQRLAEDVKS